MTATIRCAILDDELLAIRFLKLLCEQIEGVEVIKAYNSPSLFLQEIETLDCEVCLLDIDMPQLNGLEVAAQLSGKKIIFTTAYSEYAAEAFDLNVIDYVRKPLKKERLEQAFKKVADGRENADRHCFEWNTPLGKTLIYTSAAVLIRTSDIDSRDKILTLSDDTTIILKNINFRTLLTLLPPNFIQINKKEVVNTAYIRMFSENGTITLTTLKHATPRFSLSDAYREDFMEFMRK